TKSLVWWARRNDVASFAERGRSSAHDARVHRSRRKNVPPTRRRKTAAARNSRDQITARWSSHQGRASSRRPRLYRRETEYEFPAKPRRAGSADDSGIDHGVRRREWTS